jgi:hypothetical protein
MQISHIRNLPATVCLTIAVLLGSVGVGFMRCRRVPRTRTGITITTLVPIPGPVDVGIVLCNGLCVTHEFRLKGS